MGYLFLVNLGPIQSFIASGRRTRDLWFGSVLLSELSKRAALTIVESEGPDDKGLEALIFPKPKSKGDLEDESTFAVANKIVAYIEGDPVALGGAVRKSVQARLSSLNAEVYSELVDAAREDGWLVRQVGELIDRELAERQVRELIDRELAERQVRELIDCVWVAVAYEKGVDDYARKRDELEQWLDARKNTREIPEATDGGSQPKSSITGQLESVIQSSLYPDRNVAPKDREKDKKAKELRRYKIFRAGPSEYLSGVDLLKRRGKFERGKKKPAQDTFLSTSHIAAIPYLDRLEGFEEDKKAEIRQKWDGYINSIKETILGANVQRGPGEALASVLEKIPKEYAEYQKSSILGRYDGALFFEERLHEDFPDPALFQKISKALGAFFDAVDKAVKPPNVRPHPYYAILRADGDGMGELIDSRAEKGPDFTGHQEVSKKLTQFAGLVKEIVEKGHKGTLLYSGGDDVLAFVPLHTVLACARELSRAFKTTLVFEGEAKPPTLSVGIAIVHHLSLLRDSLELARHVEEVQAKGVPGKGALAITLYRRSGEEYGVKGKLAELDDYLAWLTPYFMSIPEEPKHAWQRISLPKGTAYELRDTSLRLKPFSNEITKEERKALQEALKVDMLRILQRKLKASAQGSDPEVKRIIRFLLCIFKKRLGVALDDDDDILIANEKTADLIGGDGQAFFEAIVKVEVPEFINEFIIAHELADVQELAGQKRLKLQAEFFKRGQEL